MTDLAEYIAKLLLKELEGELSPAEAAELEQWRLSSTRHQEEHKFITDPEQMSQLLGIWYKYDNANIEHRLQQEFPGISLQSKKKSTPAPAVHRIHFLRKGFLKYAAAILIVVTGISIYISHTAENKKGEAKNTPPRVSNDVMPGNNKAILTLSNGQQVLLNTASSETIHDGTLSIENSKGKLYYKNTKAVGVNTMTTPKGGQYQLTLSDGTMVWLNAASSVTFPTAFEESTREVLVTGEVYFEVAKNKQKPFIVKTPTEKITVLGTEFNVNAYPDEIAKTSLINGSIKINNSVLQAGQAFVSGKVQPTSIEQDIAWKNGTFNLENLTVEQAMRQLARWYDVEVVYEAGTITTRLSGAMDRKLTLNEALEGLNGLVARFRVTGRTVYVSPLK